MSVSARLCSCLAPHAYTIWLNKQIHQCNMLNLESVAFLPKSFYVKTIDDFVERERESAKEMESNMERNKCLY